MRYNLIRTIKQVIITHLKSLSTLVADMKNQNNSSKFKWAPLIILIYMILKAFLKYYIYNYVLLEDKCVDHS